MSEEPKGPVVGLSPEIAGAVKHGEIAITATAMGAGGGGATATFPGATALIEPPPVKNDRCWRCGGSGQRGNTGNGHGTGPCWHCRGTGSALFADLWWRIAQQLPGNREAVASECDRLAKYAIEGVRK